MNEEIKKQIEKLMENIELLQEINDTVLDQVSELNLLIAEKRSGKKSVYEQMLIDFDETLKEQMKEDK